jgi:hypothetical protein
MLLPPPDDKEASMAQERLTLHKIHEILRFFEKNALLVHDIRGGYVPTFNYAGTPAGVRHFFGRWSR